MVVGRGRLEHVREQLAALPNLTSLSLVDLSWAGGEEEDEQQAGRLISSTVTRLELTQADAWEDSSWVLQRLPTQFPNLRDLEALVLNVDDAGLDAFLRLPHLERLHVRGLQLRRSHAHMACRWADLKVTELDVGSFARLPLDGIQACSGWWTVRPSADAAAVARVAQAVRRWGCLGGCRTGSRVRGHDAAALVTTLGPLLAALPAEQQRQVSIEDLWDATPQQVQQLGQQLPPGVTTLRLNRYKLVSDAWTALLPSLPATVAELRLEDTSSPDLKEHVVALCQAGVRPIRVVVPLSRSGPGVAEQDLERMRASLVGPDGLPSLVTLSAE